MRRSLLPCLALGGILAACGSSASRSDEAGDTTSAATVATVDTPSSGSTSSTPGTGSGPPFTATPLTPKPATAPAVSTPPDAGPPPTVDAATAQLPAIQAAVADLASMLDVGPSAVSVLEVREVTWRDGSLGCPEPGLNATQALVNGQLVVLESGGVRYEYHSGPQRPLFYCAKPDPPFEG